MKKWDVIVVGSGPAGSTAARICAEKKLQVLIIDKEKFPRDKDCGGGLSIGALKELNLSLPDFLIEQICYGMRSIFRNRNSFILDKNPVAYMINRMDFDSYLLDKAIEAGAEYKHLTCINVSETDDFVLIKTEKENLESQICIGADGYFSETAKAVREPFSEEEKRFCLVSTVQNTEHPIFKNQRLSVELDFGFIHQGYGWLFPKSDFISAGIGGAGNNSNNLKTQFRTFLDSHNLTESTPFKGCFIPVSHLKHPVCTDRIMLTGDAAGFVDCFSGEGIKNALISGRIAAETANEVLHKRKYYSVKIYKKKIYSLIANDLIWSMRISNLSYRFENLIFGNLLSNERIMKKYFKVMRGEKSYRSFFFETTIYFPVLLLRKFFYRFHKKN